MEELTKGLTPIFKIKSLKSLEEDIKKEFGEEGIKYVKESELKLLIAFDGLSKVKWKKENLTNKNGYSRGKEYFLTIPPTITSIISNSGVFAYHVKDVPVYYWNNINARNFVENVIIEWDLKKNQKLRIVLYHQILQENL